MKKNNDKRPVQAQVNGIKLKDVVIRLHRIDVSNERTKNHERNDVSIIIMFHKS